MKSIILFLLLFSFTFAQESIVNIYSDTSSITNFKLDYFIDKTQKMDFEEVKSQKFIQGKNKDSLGVDITDTWIKIKLYNTTNEIQTLFLHQDIAYLYTNIKYFEVDENDNLINKKEIDLSQYSSKKKMNGSDSIFKFTLKQNQIKTIYVAQKTFAYHFYNFSIFSEKESREYLVYEKIDAILFVGLLVALAIYNLLIFISLRYKEYLYYSLYLVSATIWIFYMYGALAHYFHIYSDDSYQFNFGLMFTPIFLALFIQSIFNTKIKYKTEDKFLTSVIILLFTNFLYALIDFNNALQFLSLALNYSIIVFLWISISIYKKGDKAIKIFLFAHIFYLILNFYTLLFYMGIVGFSYISLHGIGIGIIIEALMLSYLISYKFKLIEQEKKQERLAKLKAIESQNKTQLLLLQKSKMADMGEMIGNIAHQWRQPLAIIGVSAGILREKKLVNRLTDKEFEEELDHIDLNILHLSQTMEDFLTYFRPNKFKEDFYILDAVNKALLIIGNILYKESIIISINVNKKDKVYGFKEEYIQVLISIITNSVYALKDKDKKTININSLHSDETLTLEISDNGGGIAENVINKIFEPYFTTKNQSIGTGLGLYIAKIIIENSMNGSLKVTNTDSGAKFSIIIL